MLPWKSDKSDVQTCYVLSRYRRLKELKLLNELQDLFGVCLSYGGDPNLPREMR